MYLTQFLARKDLEIIHMEYKLCLIEWGLGTYESVFEDEGIDDESFKLLDEETINKIFFKSGPKLIFKKKYQEYLKKNTIENFDQTSTPTISTIDVESNISTDTYNFEPDNELAYALSLSNENLNQIQDIALSEAPKPMLPLLPKRSYTEIWSLPPLNSNIDEIPTKMFRIDTVFPDGLEAVLRKSTDGQIILLNKQKLNNDLRQKLAKVVINELITVFGKEIRTCTLSKVTKEIVSLFPNEVADTYFIPYKPKRVPEDGSSQKFLAKSSNAKGKLWSRYIYVRAALRLANSHKTATEEPKKLSNSPEPNKEEVSSLEFLRLGTEPFTKVLEAWEQTYKQRKKLYLNCEVSRFFTDFPCLKCNSGIELIETDFNKKFPHKGDIIYNTWPKVAQAICKEAKEKKMSVSENVDPSEISSALLLLPYLFSPVTLKKSRKSGNWRPTRSEVAESFFLQISSVDELENRISKRKEKLHEFQLTLQPFGVFIGNPFNADCDIYIIVEEVKYQINSQVRALELLFKLFHALDIEYPAECEHIWLFIEELVFEMKPSKKMSSTASVVADIKYHME